MMESLMREWRNIRWFLLAVLWLIIVAVWIYKGEGFMAIATAIVFHAFYTTANKRRVNE